MGWNYNKRAFAHNYYAPFIYHIILRKRERFPAFGMVCGDARIPYGNPGCAYIKENELGQTISKSIVGLPKKYPIIRIYQHKLMPDHVHILLRVLEWSPYHLDFYVEELMSYIAKRISIIINHPTSPEDIFDKGYCDKPLLLQRSLPELFDYIRNNPHRLAMRLQYPDFFRRSRQLRINGKEYEGYGNLFLLRNPDKMAVKISRKYSCSKKEELTLKWVGNAQKGSVMVSPFISREEKQIREKIEAAHGSIILIVHEAFPEKYKPGPQNFELCSRGRLLILSLGYDPKTRLSREICRRMNELAAEIAVSPYI